MWSLKENSESSLSCDQWGDPWLQGSFGSGEIQRVICIFLVINSSVTVLGQHPTVFRWWINTKQRRHQVSQFADWVPGRSGWAEKAELKPRISGTSWNWNQLDIGSAEPWGIPCQPKLGWGHIPGPVWAVPGLMQQGKFAVSGPASSSPPLQHLMQG